MDKRKPYPSEQQDRFIVRFPDGMRDRIAEEAKKNNRSMNAEIIARLQATFANESPDTSAMKFTLAYPQQMEKLAAAIRENIEQTVREEVAKYHVEEVVREPKDSK